MKKVIKYLLLGLGALTLVGIIGVALEKPEAKAATEKQNLASGVSPDSTTSLDPAATDTKGSWAYSEDVDKMDNKKTLFASTTSTNSVDFDFPYQGGSTFDLIIRNTNKRNEVILRVSKGQFTTSIMEDQTVRIKFDDAAPITVTYNSARDGSSDVIFLNQSSKIIQKLKAAKRVMIEAEFFQEGRKQAEFDVNGLQWSY